MKGFCYCKNKCLAASVTVFKAHLLTHQADIFELQHNYTFVIQHYTLGLNKCKCESYVTVKALIC